MLSIKNISKRYANHVALNELSIDIQPGQFCALLGPNGAGKSSLLRCVANQLSTGGNARDQLNPEGCTGYLFAGELGLRAELSVFDQAFYFSELFSATGQPLSERKVNIQHFLTRVGLLDWSDEKVGTLSSGQKVRLGLCGLLMSACQVWLLDEPTVSLDVASVALFGAVLRGHLGQGGAALIATHIDLGLPEARDLDLTPYKAVQPALDEVFG